MASLDSLPPDQRAVLQLVLQRGRSYDDIAQLLSIDRAAVRERALNAFDALGPGTGVAPERRALITDYLLSQLPPRVSDDTRERLAESPGERAWARVVASEISPLTNGPLPEIPVEAARREPRSLQPASTPSEEPAVAPPPDFGAAGPAPEPGHEPEPIGTPEPRRARARRATPAPPGAPPPRSRRGGAVLLVGGALIAVIVVVVVIALVSGGSSNSSSSSTAAANGTTPTSSTPTTGTTAKPIAQVNLVSPTGSKKTAGIAEVVKQGTNTGLVIVAQGVPANTSHDAYAVWLYNSPSDDHILGFVNPGVKSTGKLQTAGVLPTNASHFKQLLVTLETQAKPKGPGKIVLQGPLKLSQ
jgi:anti-sigma-K factor RskA/sigma-70-like protein